MHFIYSFPVTCTVTRHGPSTGHAILHERKSYKYLLLRKFLKEIELESWDSLD